MGGVLTKTGARKVLYSLEDIEAMDNVCDYEKMECREVAKDEDVIGFFETSETAFCGSRTFIQVYKDSIVDVLW